MQSLVAALPLSHLLLETDSPALGPEKGVDNEPANIVVSAREIARIKGVEIDEVVGLVGKGQKGITVFRSGEQALGTTF